MVGVGEGGGGVSWWQPRSAQTYRLQTISSVIIIWKTIADAVTATARGGVTSATSAMVAASTAAPTATEAVAFQDH